MIRRSVLLFLLVLIGLNPSYAQEKEPLAKDLKHHFKRKALSLGILLQAGLDVQFTQHRESGTNGFRLFTSRIKVSGILDHGFSYMLQTDFTRTLAVLDARVGLAISPQVAFYAGQFKSPFSYEFLTSSAKLDFVKRSQVVSALAPNRQVGAQATLSTADKRFQIMTGIFNGNGRNPGGNDDATFLYVARAEAHLPVADKKGKLILGVNSAYNQDEWRGVSRERMLIGADARIQMAKLLISGEFIYAKDKLRNNQEFTPYGYQLTAGVKIDPIRQLLVRYDTYSSDYSPDTSTYVILGYTCKPTHLAKIQINYLIPTAHTAFKYHHVLAKMQIAF